MAALLCSSMMQCCFGQLLVAAGDVLLDGLRVNQLKLSRNLTGSLQVSDREMHMHAKVRHQLNGSCLSQLAEDKQFRLSCNVPGSLPASVAFLFCSNALL